MTFLLFSAIVSHTQRRHFSFPLVEYILVRELPPKGQFLILLLAINSPLMEGKEHNQNPSFNLEGSIDFIGLARKERVS